MQRAAGEVSDMSEPRVITLDGCAAGFAAVGGLLAAAVLSHDPYDTGLNWLGEPGNGVAAALLETLGYGSFVLLAAWAMLTFHLVMWRHWGKWSLRVAGWTILVLAVAVVADWGAYGAASDPLMEGGGSVGV